MMRFLFDFAKVFLLLVGAALIIGGGAVGLCGAIVFDGEKLLWGLVATVVGAALFVYINRSFIQARANSAKRGARKDET
jgi:hypothetical protein